MASLFPFSIFRAEAERIHSGQRSAVMECHTATAEIWRVMQNLVGTSSSIFLAQQRGPKKIKIEIGMAVISNLWPGGLKRGIETEPGTGIEAVSRMHWG